MMNDDSPITLLEPTPVASAVRRSVPVRNKPAELPEPSWIDRGHIPGLDGLRAIAVLMIVAVHGCQTVGFPQSPLLKSLAFQGAIGVDVFFVISGFLITTLLARETDRVAGVQLKRFYLRRFLRIMPAYIGLLVAVAVAQSIGYFHLETRDWIGAATYTTNFLYHPAWELGHTWSLSVEEHFYLLWPIVLYAGGVTWGWRIGLACLAGCWLIRCGIAFGLTRIIFPTESAYSDVSMCALMAENWTFTRLDTITMGSLLALACRSAKGRLWLDRLTSASMLWFYVATICGSLALTRSSKYTLCIAYTLNGLCISLLIWGLIQSQGRVRHLLANPLLKVIGLGSYSIYLWQQLFLNPHHAGWIHQFPQNVVLSLGAAFLSFWLIEQPINRLKDRIAPAR